MVKQYPYQLQVLSVIEGGKDEDGNNQASTDSWNEYAGCRDEAGNGKMVATVDGTMSSFSFLIQLPKGTEALQAGTTVRVMNGSLVRCSGKVIYSRKDQLHTRAWV